MIVCTINNPAQNLTSMNFAIELKFFLETIVLNWSGRINFAIYLGYLCSNRVETMFKMLVKMEQIRELYMTNDQILPLVILLFRWSFVVENGSFGKAK